MFKRSRNKQQWFEFPDSEYTTKGNYGLEICRDSDEAVADVVFIHGLTGNRRSTWTEKQTNCFWPKEVLARDVLPPTRILSYGYDADVAHFWALSSQNRLNEHAGNLVNALAQLRNRSETEGRPIIFVAHSLGGLVTEDAILFSKNTADQHLQDIAHSVAGICFLGTPHCGADLAKWTSVATRLINTIKTTNLSLVRTLKPNSEVLARVQREFQNMHRTLPAETAFGITCFFEELPVRVVGEIVPKHSATLSGFNAIGIHANHMNMSKYGSPYDPGYQAVSGEIRRWLKEIEARHDAAKPVSSTQLPRADSSSRAHNMQSPLIAREPQSYLKGDSDDRTPDHGAYSLSHRAEPVLTHLAPATSNSSSSHVRSESKAPDMYAYAGTRSPEHTAPEVSRSNSHTPIPDPTRDYVQTSPGNQTHHARSLGYSQSYNPYESTRLHTSAYTDNRFQGNTPNEASFASSHASLPGWGQNGNPFSQQEIRRSDPDYGGTNNGGFHFNGGGGIGIHNGVSGGVNNGGIHNGGVHNHGPIHNGGVHNHSPVHNGDVHHGSTIYRDISHSGSGNQLIGNTTGNMYFK